MRCNLPAVFDIFRALPLNVGRHLTKLIMLLRAAVTPATRFFNLVFEGLKLCAPSGRASEVAFVIFWLAMVDVTRWRRASLGSTVEFAAD